ncbi:MAG: hypothetical protein IJ561_05155 [Ruminococcus sp.]|nr:hypothetical protein [Ruminococcus sp.]
MNGNDILKAMNGIDPALLTEETAAAHTEQRKKIFRRPAAMAAAIAAALALTVTAGAVVIRSKYYHKESVEHYIAGGDSIASYTVEATENEHIRVTLDSIWSTGIKATAIMTVDPLDDEGKEMAKHISVIDFSYADDPDGSEKLYLANGRMWADESLVSTTGQMKYRCCFYLDGKDISRLIKLHFGYYSSDDLDNPKPEELIDYGISADVDFTPNTEIVELFADNGHSLFLSPFEIYQREKNGKGEVNEAVSWNIELIRSDGTLEPIKSFWEGETSAWSADNPYERYCEVEFFKAINVDDYKGVKVGDTEFLRK